MLIQSCCLLSKVQCYWYKSTEFLLMQQRNITESPSYSNCSWCLKVIYTKNLDFVLVIIKVTCRPTHWGSLRVSCQTSALQKSIYSSPSEPRRPLIRWRNVDNQPSSSAPRLHTLSDRCTCWASSRVWLLQGSKTHKKTKQNKSVSSENTHGKQQCLWQNNSRSLTSSCPPPRPRRGQHPWWTQRWPSG